MCKLKPTVRVIVTIIDIMNKLNNHYQSHQRLVLSLSGSFTLVVLRKEARKTNICKFDQQIFIVSLGPHGGYFRMRKLKSQVAKVSTVRVEKTFALVVQHSHRKCESSLT